ncbi:hypothetical protein WJX77_007166 [Trebouxia sp. C0004]
MACPMGHISPQAKDTSGRSEPLQKWLETKKRVIMLYEEYIHLLPLQQIWENPATEKPVLEPCFVAAFHGIELCFLLLAEFISDDRKYVFRRPRVEMVANDIQKQCLLLTEVVDGELEEDNAHVSRASLTQHFPFEACPPTIKQASHSPCLQRLINAVVASKDGMTVAERNSLIKVVLNITNTFDSSFSRWTVGLGIEHQLNELRVAAGLAEEARFRARARNLDYAQLVHPEVVEATLSGEVYEHEEDFFFRAVHLGSECWAFVVHNRVAIAQQCAEEGQWNIAAARIIQATRMLHYLGDHILMLTSMNLRDYLRLKVEIQGTSGEGSKAVKSFRTKLESLFHPLTDALAYHDAVSDTEELLDSSYSQPLSPCLSSETQAQPASQPQTYPKSSPQANPQFNVLNRQSSTPRQSPTATPGTGVVSSNGDAHALTSAHRSAATIADSAQQAAAEQTCAPDPQQSAAAEAREVKLKGLLEVYEEPDSHAGLYNYAKALEDVEAGLLAGFFYKHFCLASNVIGSESKGTGYMGSTNRAITALKATFQTPVYPMLDQVRSALGAKIDLELAHLKGRIMDNIEAKRGYGHI